MENQTREIDWEMIKQRMARVSQALEQGAASSEQETRDVLQERARELARPLEVSDRAADLIEVTTFLLDGETYAFEMPYIREVCRFKSLTSIPCTPTFVLGVMALRGEIVSIIDLRPIFSLPSGEITGDSSVIILRSSEMEFGVIVDAMLGVRSIHKQQIHPPPSTFVGARAEYITGVTSESVVLLDAGRLLADPRLIVHDEIEA